MEAQEEQRLARGQREYLDLEIRKFRRKKLLIFHSLEQELLREVCIFFDMLKSFFNY
jgi:thousand and one amino acid protein kinase